MTAAKTASNECVSWDTRPATTDNHPSFSSASTPTVIPKTVDYGHGHGMSIRNKQYCMKLAKFQDFIGYICTQSFRTWNHC